MRDIAIFLTVFGILPFCFNRPFIGLLLYFWLSFMNPHKLAWGLAYNFPFAGLAAGVTIIGTAIMLFRREPRAPFPRGRETTLLVMLIALFTLTTPFSMLPEEAWPEWQNIAKIFLMTFLTLVLIDDERKFRYFAIVVALSVGFYGLKGGLFSVRTGGQSLVLGPGGTIGDNTALGLALNMVLPMLFFLARTEDNRWFRRFLYMTFGFSIIAIVFTYSRGAWLGLLAVCWLLFVTVKPTYRVAVIVLGLLCIPIVISLIPEKATERAMTLQTYEQDSSAMKRLAAWATAWQVALDRPLTGGGFSVIDDAEIGQRYNPDFTEAEVGVHSIYFEVLGESGFVTFAVFMSLLFFSWLSTRRIQTLAKQFERQDLALYGRMLELGLIAYGISGAFLEAAHFDLFYALVAMIIILKAITQRSANAVLQEAPAEPPPARTGTFAADGQVGLTHH